MPSRKAATHWRDFSRMPLLLLSLLGSFRARESRRSVKAVRLNGILVQIPAGTSVLVFFGQSSTLLFNVLRSSRLERRSFSVAHPMNNPTQNLDLEFPASRRRL